MAKKRKRSLQRTVHLDWCGRCVAVFELPVRLAWTPPAKAKVVLVGNRSTWSARFLDAQGQPVNAVVRLKHLADGDIEIISDEIHVRFRSTAEQLREVA